MLSSGSAPSSSSSSPTSDRSLPPLRFSSSSSSSSSAPFFHRPFLPLLALLLLIPSAPSLVGGAAVTNRDEHSEGNSVGHELVAYDNEIISEPDIECGPGIVHFNVKTRKGNASAVYVRGQSQNADCTFHNTRNVTIELAKCNVRRKREVNPNPGIAYQMTLVVQLHPLFVTKVDRAYNVNCFYREQKQDVSVDFGVNELVTQQMQSQAILPNCSYSVHRDSPNGPRVKYTHVGEQLYHVWECPSTMYAMLLYNCNAVDGKGDEYPIIDANGCSRDEFLMPQISYTQDRTRASAASSAFNFPDRNTMLFTCKIKLCMLNDAECSNLTPPNCNGKKAKGTAETDENFNVDITGRGESAKGTTLNPEGSTTELGTTRTVGRGGRTEVSGEVAEAEGATTAKEREGAEEEKENGSTTGTMSTGSGSSSATEKTMGTTEEQLLGSEERAGSNSESAEAHRSSKNATEGTTNGADQDQGRERASTAAAHKHTNEAGGVPSDFPRPGLLLQRDQPKDEGAEEAKKRKERMQRLAEGQDGSWTIDEEEEGKGKDRDREQEEEEREFQGTTRPVQVFKKKTEEGGGGRQAGRAQRDTPRGAGRRRMAEVDFDIQSPELMIMDDYEPTAAAQKSPAQRSSIQEAPFVTDWAQQQPPRPSASVCFSPAALICAGALLLLLVLAVLVALLKATRKSAIMLENSWS